MKCLLCSATLDQALFPIYDPQTKEAFSLLFCQPCELGQTSPQPQDLTPYYSAYYGKRHGFSATLCVRRRLAWVRQMTRGKTGKLLDIGCGDGQFLREAVRAGWQVAGTERNPAPARAAGFEVAEELQQLQARAPFDCITLWHSLEHLVSPHVLLRQLHEFLSPHGVLLIAVPNAQGWQARFFGSKWLHWDPPRHLYHFGPASLRALLQAENFELLRCWHQEFEYDILGWSQSALNCIFTTSNGFFQELIGAPVKVGSALRLLNWVGGLIFSALALPLLPFATFFGAGGTLVVAAQRCERGLRVEDTP